MLQLLLSAPQHSSVYIGVNQLSSHSLHSWRVEWNEVDQHTSAEVVISSPEAVVCTCCHSVGSQPTNRL